MPVQVTNSVRKLSAELAAAKLYRMGVRSWQDFKTLKTEGFEGVFRPADVPSNPTTYYDEVDSFKEFMRLGRQLVETDNEALEKMEMPSLAELKEKVTELNIDSHRKWQHAVRAGLIKGNYPKRPDRYYADWSGWADFLAPKKRFADFEEAHEMAKKLAYYYDLKTQSDWRNLSRDRKRPRNLPSNPNEYYAEHWVSWSHFYGLDD